MDITLKRFTRSGLIGLSSMLLVACVLPAPAAPTPVTDSRTPFEATVTPLATAATSTAEPGFQASPAPTRETRQPASSPTLTIPVSPTVATREWQGWPVGPAVSQVLANEANVMAWTSTALLGEVEQFYRTRADETDTLLVEVLTSKGKSPIGEVLFLNLVQSDKNACLLTYTEQTASLTNLLLSETCDIVRASADEMRGAPWSVASGTAWHTWTADGVAMHYPAAWMPDTSLAQQSYCQPSTGVDCWAAFNGGSDAADATIILTSKARADGQSLEQFATECMQQVFATVTRSELLTVEPIRLDNGNEALQVLALVEVQRTQALFITVSTIGGDEFYQFTGTITGDIKKSLELSSIVLASARSLQIRR